MKTNKIAIGLLILSLFINLIFIFTNYFNINKLSSVSSTSKSGKIVVTVLEEGTLDPIDNATVCVIETKKYYQTNKKGITKNIQVPIITNNNFNLSLPRTWGEVTLLVYKPGYADNINFYTSVTKNTTRVGIVVYLSPIINKEDIKTDISLEPPNKDWTQELIKHFKK